MTIENSTDLISVNRNQLKYSSFNNLKAYTYVNKYKNKIVNLAVQQKGVPRELGVGIKTNYGRQGIRPQSCSVWTSHITMSKSARLTENIYWT
jgi:hypothetical protein